MKTALAALAFVLLTGANAFAAAVRPVVVELYTSQGCNSCLSANTMAGKIAQKPGVLLLSFAVTYWDMFGWKDTLANDDNTKRQRAYAAALHRGGVYTPQMIIDGIRDVSASKADAVAYALEMAAMKRDDGYQPDDETPAALARKDGPPVAIVAGARVKTTMHAAWSVGVAISKGPGGLHVAVERAPERHGIDATVWLLRVRSNATVKITGGEAAGQTVTYRNVVTGIQNLGPWRGEARTFDVLKPQGKIAGYDSVAVLVQQGAGYGRIVGAALQPGQAY